MATAASTSGSGAAPAARVISHEELNKHSSPGDAWLAVNGEVYNISKFAAMHPGGEQIILEHAGTDASEVFWSYHAYEVLKKYAKLKIGLLEGAKPLKVIESDEISTVPFSEPSYWLGWESPYYNETHRKFRADVRKLLDTLRDEAEVGESKGTPPSQETYELLGREGYLAARVGKIALPYVDKLPGGLPMDKYDYFHEAIAHEEVAHLTTPGYLAGMGEGMVIGLPPVLQFGNNWMKETVGKDVLMGKKRICLAITEPSGGSDVANLLTRAEKTPDGKHYLVSGTKKWITGGCESEYFTTAVRTGGKGQNGVSMLLIERGPGVETTHIPTSYSAAAGTAYVTFQNAKVPVENLIGMENMGFLCIMYNFNHERWFIIAYILSATRGVIEQSVRWAHQRKAFGKRLIDQPVIRHKLAHSIAELEAVHNWYENVTHQMNKLPYEQQSMKLGGAVSLLKLQATRVAHRVSDEVVQIFGGRGLTRTGMGRMVERFKNTYKFAAILGGSEEIMADLGIKLAFKSFPPNAKL
mmetsp:Transcript_41629/g.107712  ORF Transcript_41629/g.107712 Transcript_41629/m.107712 type:complete len:526 (-) Transcript_41629:171-1748(-)|eukprot:CAMPEP_0195104590 /NCGR_PEP_ID=MMETSP0448-20130528/73187_1 /TAXON_ID=66468 /ORGANISM="Heterocapsa triquestra, Strain CCMP 448" /LENGTH=525 /DNA_ID=CAMNT_0040140449 /DNA_START=74 /DNA_END=1651 /DNA_ORIENTATION=-